MPEVDETIGGSAAGAEGELSQSTIELGRKLRTMRKQKGLTIRDLASRAGVANGLLSQIERGLSSPSLRTLTKLKTALDIRLGDLFTDKDDQPDPEAHFVKRFEDRAILDLGPHKMIKELLSPDLEADLQMMMLIVPPGGGAGAPYTHSGVKSGIVIEGYFELMIEGKVFSLRKDDSFQFDSSKPHTFRNGHATLTARVLWMLQKSAAQQGDGV